MISNGGVVQMDVIKRIEDLMKERNWTDYKLSKKSGLSSSTIANMRRRNTIPSIPTLETICEAFGISLSQFFQHDCDYVFLNENQKKFFQKWEVLSEKQKIILEDIINEFNS